ncbi:replicative DNA helicase [Ottowia sp.]|uniref:replicative DNA helicase n=1 Tax=Ottowia sp. TaxID=1898956 RepID=UPI002C3EA32B|nr:replicative DNA helicase [Ottowia sp.]HOB66633.1 replicative DNA helicase [Ottowia sp.]HPZ56473.1 replicative DNA helicase [Ottowia sp.]HQD47629.1 replicative DNA helicase [Ottowia sp.]
MSDMTDTLHLQVPPHSAESEASLLGGLLLDNRAYERVDDLLTEGDFYRREHRLVFAAIAKLIHAGKPADVITVHEALQRQGKGDEIGGLVYLNSLAQYLPSTHNIRRYAEIVREKSILRQIVGAAEQARALALSNTAPAHAIEQALGLFSGIEVRHGDREPQRVDSLAVAFLDRVNDLAEGRIQAGISTGFPAIDRRLGGGLKPGRQIVIAARPSVGKSSLAMQVLLNVAARGEPVLFVSQEMEQPELMDRIVANLGRADMGGISTGQLSQDGWARVTEGAQRLKDLPLYLHSEGGLSLAAIRSIARRMVRRHGVRVVVLDYLQLCAASAGKRDSNRHHQLEELSRGLKALAMELGVSTVVLSQLNREVEKRTGGRPVMADLKESGSIEEDADSVVLLSREGELSDGAMAILADVAKARGGVTGPCHLRFEGAFQRWEETTERPMQKKVERFEL